MPKSIDTVILPVAGVGSRMLPLTTAIEKCMLPVAGRPVIDYAIEDCQKAGIKRIIFICSERGERQLKDYYGELNPGVEAQLKALGKLDLIAREHERRSAYGITFEYIRQEPGADHGYGTVVPLYLAKELLQGQEYFGYFMGDDIVYHADGTSELAQAIAAWQGQEAQHVIMAIEVPRDQASRYAVLSLDENHQLSGIVEKPAAEKIPERPVVTIGRYIFGASIWEYIDKEMKQHRALPEEHMITTHVIQPSVDAGQDFYVHTVSGVYLDGGSPAGLQAANGYIAEHTS